MTLFACHNNIKQVTIRMKAFVCFALFAVAAAIPLQDAQVVIIPDGPMPIPVEMLRSGSFVPVWRDLPQVEDFRPIPESNMRDGANFKISPVQFVNDIPEDVQAVYAEVPSDVVDGEIVPEAVKVVDSLTNEAELTAPAEEIASEAGEIVPEAVKVVEYSEPASMDILAPELPASEDAEMRFVKFVDSPATFDLKNMKVPIDAHDIV